jgi:hypothetical protein
MSDEHLAKIEARLDRLEGIFRSIADLTIAEAMIANADLVKRLQNQGYTVTLKDASKPELAKPIPTAIPATLPTAEELEHIPWTAFKNRPGAWFFSKPRDPVPAMDRLRAALDAAGHELEIGGQVYGFNDAKHDFVGRYPKAVK